MHPDEAAPLLPPLQVQVEEKNGLRDEMEREEEEEEPFCIYVGPRWDDGRGETMAGGDRDDEDGLQRARSGASSSSSSASSHHPSSTGGSTFDAEARNDASPTAVSSRRESTAEQEREGSRGPQTSKNTGGHVIPHGVRIEREEGQADEETMSELPDGSVINHHHHHGRDIEPRDWAYRTSHRSPSPSMAGPPISHPNSHEHHRRHRSSPFRHPSSVRALQLGTTPPATPTSTGPPSPLRQPRPRAAHDRGLSPVTTSMPPSSSSSSSSSHRRARVKKAQPREHPLVLLHVTLLPRPTPFSAAAVLSCVRAPCWLLDAYSVLQEQMSPTMLERGILLAHPRDDYELLEERLLESLELKTPRILKCGHFMPSGAAAAAVVDDEEMCVDCHRPISAPPRLAAAAAAAAAAPRPDPDPRLVDPPRWTINVYAATGLMRAGAWAAAWREMERVDVEIEPYVSDDLRRELEARQQQLAQEQEQDQEQKQTLLDASDGEARPPPVPRRVPLPLPLATLLKRYLARQASDPRNLLVALLSVLVLVLALVLALFVPVGGFASFVRFFIFIFFFVFVVVDFCVGDDYSCVCAEECGGQVEFCFFFFCFFFFGVGGGVAGGVGGGRLAGPASSVPASLLLPTTHRHHDDDDDDDDDNNKKNDHNERLHHYHDNVNNVNSLNQRKLLRSERHDEQTPS
ncbi:MAG: hypothetical protein M1826_005864 [Phylliscum demangeonii]|nr:MAG: hypothetical protein M1826_005864 [Phylliscum demangeonii]